MIYFAPDMRKISFFSIFGVLLLSTLLTSCLNNITYLDYSPLPEASWKQDSTLVFPLVIEDTTKAYQGSYLVRYNLDYPFANLYIKYAIKDSVGNTLDSNLHQMLLMEPVSGRPLGSGVGELRDRYVLGFETIKFPYRGKYSLHLQQYMRKDPLYGIVAMGFELKEKE